MAKFIDTETGHQMVEVAGHDGKYASKGVAGTGLGLGIAGTALWLLSGGLNNGLGGLFGGSCNRAYGVGAGAWVDAVMEKDDIDALTNGMWQLAYNGQNARFADRQTINAEMFGIYKSQVDADFGLYKGYRDMFDIANARIGKLEKEVAVMAATRPYQDRLIQCDIQRVADFANFNLYRRTCRMIEGQVVLPSTPTVTGFGSYSSCPCANQAQTTTTQEGA